MCDSQEVVPANGKLSDKNYSVSRNVRVGAIPFAILKMCGFRFDKIEIVKVEGPKIPTLAKTARMGHPAKNCLSGRFSNSHST